LDDIQESKDCFGCWDNIASSREMRATIRHLEALGSQLCNQLPMSWLCNNPACSNLSGVSELQLVGGKACVCGGCQVAR
jgi:hypothetical protein